jgi:hypothetical protein
MEKLLYEHEKQRIENVVSGARKTCMVIYYTDGGTAHYRIFHETIEFHNAPIDKEFGLISPNINLNENEYSALGEYHEWILK